jgi:hypothetical protein
VQQLGDASAGFAVALDPSTKGMHIRAWGFWNVEVAMAFGRIAVAECRSSPGISAVVMDMKELKPMREEGQWSFGELISILVQLAIPLVEVETGSQLTRLQLMRIVNQRDTNRRVQFK